MKSNYYPETKLLNYYCEGVPRDFDTSNLDMSKIVQALNDKKIKIYFPYYWNQHDLRNFKKKYNVQINPSLIVQVTRRLLELLINRNERSVHWIERINLFHLFGLLRIYGNINSAEVIQFVDTIISSRLKTNINNFILVSAINTKSVLEKRDLKDTTEFFNLAEHDLNIVRDFGNYQMYYHGGILNCINELQSDLGKDNKVPISNSIISLLVACDMYYGIECEYKTIIYDKLYSEIHAKAKNTIDRIYKEVQRKLLGIK